MSLKSAELSIVGGPVTKISIDLRDGTLELQDNQLPSADHLLGAMHLRKDVAENTNGL
jgi:hypothetical protein